MNPFTTLRRRPGPALMIAALLLIAGVVAWRMLQPAPPPALATAVASVSDLDQTVLATGTLEASRQVSVGAQASGQIRSLKVALGETVKAGDLIAEIDSTTQRNTLRNAQAALASAKAQRAVQVANLRQAQLAFERQQTMLARDATSRADYEAAEATLGTTRAQIEALDAQIVQAETSVSTAEANLGYTKIVAPMDGTIVAVVAKEGQTVNAVQSSPTIVKLARLDTMTVSAEISEADVIRVRPGQTAYFTILGNPDKRYYGKLRSIEPAPASEQTESTSAVGGASTSSSSSTSSQAIYYNALFEVPNPDGELRISMTAQVSVVLASAKQTLTIPSSALGAKLPDGRRLVQTVDAQGRPQPRAVRVGLDTNVIAQITAGLQAGERVVVGEAQAGAAPARPAFGPAGGGMGGGPQGMPR